jgi:hypothetical protein
VARQYERELGSLRQAIQSCDKYVAGVAGSAEGGGISKALGGIAIPDGVLPGIAIGSNGQIYVVWGKNAPEKHVIVSALSSSGWVTLGATVDDPNAEYDSGLTDIPTPEYRGASRPSIALTSDNAPAVAYITQSSMSSGDVHVRRWSGGTWQPFGTGAATNRGISDIGPHSAAGYDLSVPRLVFSLAGIAHAGWLYSDDSQKLIHLRRLDGNIWVDAGAFAFRAVGECCGWLQSWFHPGEFSPGGVGGRPADTGTYRQYRDLREQARTDEHRQLRLAGIRRGIGERHRRERQPERFGLPLR